MTDDLMTIREMCDAFDVTPRTLRFYEAKELLSPIREGQKRLYTQRCRARLTLILRGKRFGFCLEDIRQLLDLYDIGDQQATQLAAHLRARPRAACGRWRRSATSSTPRSPTSRSSSPGPRQMLGRARPRHGRRMTREDTTWPATPPPLRDMQFVLHDVLRVSESRIPGYAELDRDITAAILEEAGKIAADVLAPLNAVGDREGCTLENGVVRTPDGLPRRLRPMRDGGWTGLDCDPDYGGQGMPYVLDTAVGEMHVVGEHGLQHVPGPDPRRLLARSTPTARRRRRRPTCRSWSPASGPAR